MLEFLEECDQFHIYDRAHDCETHLNAYDCVTPIAVFFEVILKSHMSYFLPPEDSETMYTLYSMLENKRLMTLIKEQYGFYDIETVHLIRIRSNRMKHSTEYSPVSDVEREKYFKCLFDFASRFYTFHTGKDTPTWREDEYQKLLKTKSAGTNIEQYSMKINELTMELEQERASSLLNEKTIEKLNGQLYELQTAARQKEACTNRLLAELSGRKKDIVDDTFTDYDYKYRKQLKLTESQQQAVDCKDRYIVTVAGPGSGKTRVLTERIARLIMEDEVKESKILALSFSSKAANEVRKRLKERLGIRASRVQVKTFHSFGLDIIRQQSDILGYPNGVEIISDSGKNKIIRDLLYPRTSRTNIGFYPDGAALAELRYYTQEISRMKACGTSGDFRIERLCQLYNQELNRGGYIDFDDMVSLPRKLFVTNPEIRAAYKKKFEHVLIDEVQDVNPFQVDIIRGIIGPQTSLFVVGDDDQCIYEWRGAIPSYIKGLVKNDAFTVIRLNDNFRSDTAIVKASSSFISRNQDRIRKMVRSRKKRNSSTASATTARWLSGEKEEALYIANTVKELVQEGTYSFSDITILMRYHKQFQVILNVFNEVGIPYYVQDDGSHYDKFIHVLKAISDIKRIGNINRAVNYPRIIMDNFLYQDLRGQYSIPNEWSVYDTFEYLCDSNVGFEDCELFRSRFSLIRELNKKIDLLTVTEVISRLYNYYVSEIKKREEDLSHIKSLIELAVDFDKGFCSSIDSSVKPIDQFIDYIRLAKEDESQEETDKDAVTLMTCHRSKGLEFPVVFIPGVQCGTFPDDRFLNNKIDLEAERRLLYVSMTRAIDRLYLTCNNDPYLGISQLDFKGFMADLPDIVLQERK